MKIISLTAENLKRIRAIEIKPDGALVQITGRNSQGKTSILDAISYALGGKDAICERPIRDGAKKAKVVCELDDITVTRTFTPGGGGTLTVIAKDGSKINSPQAALDALVGKLSFDPLAFTRMNPKAQSETLKALVGLDFSEIDAERAALYEKRTALNRNVSTLQAELRGLPEHGDAPAEEVSVSDLMTKFQAGQRANDDIRRRQDDLAKDEGLAAVRRAEIEELEKKLSAAKKALKELEAVHKQRRESLAGVELTDLAPIQKQITDSDQINRKVRANAQRAKVAASLKQTTATADKLTASIEALDEQKAAKLAAASFPVEGLSFDENGVLLNGLPFSQSSGAEQLKTSVAIGLASNPTLRVLLIRDGSLLDADSLEMVAQMAEGYDSQIWLEKVSDGGAIGVVIEDGMVSGVNSQTEAAMASTEAQ